MEIKKFKRKFVGWGIKGKPFTKEQWQKSHIKKSFGGTYVGYKKDIKTGLTSKIKRVRSSTRAAMR